MTKTAQNKISRCRGLFKAREAGIRVPAKKRAPKAKSQTLEFSGALSCGKSANLYLCGRALVDRGQTWFDVRTLNQVRTTQGSNHLKDLHMSQLRDRITQVESRIKDLLVRL